MKNIFSLMVLLILYTAPYAQNLIEIRGIVKNKSDSKPLEYAHILSSDKCAGATTNNYGEFLIKIPENHKSDSIRISYMGYQTKTLPVIDCINKSITVFLEPKNKNLNEVVISANSALELLKQAIVQIPKNYPTEPYLAEAYYTQKDSVDSCKSEQFDAILNIFEHSYKSTKENDSVELVKVKYSKESSGLVTWSNEISNLMSSDLVKYQNNFLDSFQFKYYEYNFEKNITEKGRNLFVISFDRKHKLRKFPYTGKIYIDSLTMSFVKIEYELNERGRKQLERRHIAAQILFFTITGCRYKLLYWNRIINYEERNSKWFLKDITSYNKIQCDCDRKDKSVVQSSHKTLSITNIETINPPRYVDKSKIYKSHIPLKYQLGKYDAEFWENYEKTHPQ